MSTDVLPTAIRLSGKSGNTNWIGWLNTINLLIKNVQILQLFTMVIKTESIYKSN